MRFLEREVYTFCGERVRGAMPWARIFVYGRAAEGDVDSGRWTGRGQHVRRARGQSNAEGATHKGARKREKMFFLFLVGKIGGMFALSPGCRQR